MKKFVKTILMLACVFTLTACGSEEAVSGLQQSKTAAAQARASQVIDLTVQLVSADNVDEMLASYNNVELGDLYTSTYIQYTGDNSFSCEGKAVSSALSSFQSGLEAMGGSITETGDPSAAVDDDTIVVMVPVTGEKAGGSVELIFTNDIYLKMTACTLNMDQTMGQLMIKAALNTILGMGTVFAVLILISLIISAFGFIPKIQASFAKPGQKAAVPARPVTAPVPAAPAVKEPEELSDDMELVAVIAAAVAAYEGTAVEGFRVRSIRRADTNNWWKN